MNGQIVRRAIGTADALNPAVRRENLGVPAVGGVMCHFVRHVLTETEALRVDTDLHEEEEDSGDEVTESLVVDHALLPECKS